MIAENAALGDVVKEWCDLCSEQCVIDIDKKRKISLSLQQTQCDQLYRFLSPSVSVERVQQTLVFRDPMKSWISWQCQYRQPSELAMLMKLKSDKILIDDVSQLLWVEKSLYPVYQPVLEQLDTPIPQYHLYIRYLRISEAILDQSQIEPGSVLLKWMLGQSVTIAPDKVLSWVERKQEDGVLKILSSVDFSLRQQEKGIFSMKGKQMSSVLKAQVASVGDAVLLTLSLQGSQGKETMSLENTVQMNLGQSVMLGSAVQTAKTKKKSCKNPWSYIPLIGSVFCRHTNETEAFKYVLVVTLV